MVILIVGLVVVLIAAIVFLCVYYDGVVKGLRATIADQEYVIELRNGRVAMLSAKLMSAQRQSLAMIEPLVQTAAAGNQVCNLMGTGERSENVGPVLVGSIPDNGGTASLFISITDKKSSFGPCPILQFDIDLENLGRELHLFYGPYGPDRWFPIDALSYVTAHVINVAAECSMFSSTKSLDEWPSKEAA